MVPGQGKSSIINCYVPRILRSSFLLRKTNMVNLPQFNGHFKKYTEKWYTMQKKGVSDDRKAAAIQPGV